jgi:hypothetical protein
VDSVKSITQQHAFGCGVACVAYAANNKYRDSLKFLDSNAAQTKGFLCKDLVTALRKFGFHYTYKYLKPRLKRHIYAEGVIVYIKKSTSYPAGHYLIRTHGLWMDPWINFRKDQNINKAQSGYRRRLPGTPIYALFPTHPL